MTIHTSFPKDPAARELQHVRADALAMAGDLRGAVTPQQLAHAVSNEQDYTLSPHQAEMILQSAGWQLDDSGRRSVYHPPVARRSDGAAGSPQLASAIVANLVPAQRTVLGGAITRPDGVVVLTSSYFDALDSLRQLGLCGAVGQGGEDFTYAALTTPLGRTAIAMLCDEKEAA